MSCTVMCERVLSHEELLELTRNGCRHLPGVLGDYTELFNKLQTNSENSLAQQNTP